MYMFASGRPAPRYADTGEVLVKHTLEETSNSGMRYTPQAFLTRFIDGGCGATLLR